MTRLQLVGAGKMGSALLAGILDAGWCPPSEVRVVELSEARRRELTETHPGVATATEPGPAEGTILATKPGHLTAAAAATAAAAGGRLLSVAAGVPLDAIETAAGDGAVVVRAMPNTPALVRQGASAIALGRHAGEDDRRWAEELLGSVGLVVEVTEADLDAVTALSGSGPAYLFLVAEALVDAGVLMGLARPLAEALAHQTILGAGALLSGSGEGAAALRAAVTSPGGTTAAAVHQLERGGVRGAVVDAVLAARDRSREMGATAPHRGPGEVTR